MNQDINRLLMEFEHAMRAINREVINPQISELTIDDLCPVLRLVAAARARYLKAMIGLGASELGADGRPSGPQFEQLRQLREEYDELVSAAQALEAAIQRGYLDVTPSKA